MSTEDNDCCCDDFQYEEYRKIQAEAQKSHREDIDEDADFEKNPKKIFLIEMIRIQIFWIILLESQKFEILLKKSTNGYISG